MSQPRAHVEHTHEPIGNVAISITGEIDLSNAQDVQARINDAVAGAHTVRLDLTRLEFLDSQGIRIINDLAIRHDQQRLTLTVIAPETGFVRQVLHYSNLDHLVGEPEQA